MSDSIWSSIKGIIGNVAPVVGSLIGGPAGSAAVKGLCDILGLKSDAAPSEIEHAFKNATPAQLIRIKELELQAEIKSQEITLGTTRVHQQDRADARKRETDKNKNGHKDRTLPFLALIMVVGFFGLACLIIFVNIRAGAMPVLDIMLGYTGSYVGQVYDYFFGSSASSRNKDKYLAQRINTG